MSIYDESGMIIDLTHKAHHRFSDLPTYIQLKGQHLKEMDFCWLQTEATEKLPANTLFCLELKGQQDNTISVDKMLSNLENKARDTLLMYSAIWLKRGEGAQMSKELPEIYSDYQKSRKIKLIMLIDESNKQAQALRALRQKLKNKLAGIESLFDITVSLINLATAEKMGLPVKALSTKIFVK